MNDAKEAPISARKLVNHCEHDVHYADNCLDCGMKDIRETERLQDELAVERQKLTRLEEALTGINRILSPGNRTMDELMRDMGYACDRARAALQSAKEEA